MPTYTIKQHGIWQGGKLHTAGAAVELSEKDRERIDPTHENLQSAEEAKHEAAKAQVDADLAKAKAIAIEKLEAEHKAKHATKHVEKKDGAK